MIIDTHAHIFEKWSGACGLSSRDLHWKYLHKNLTRPAAKVFRFRDGAPAEAQLLYEAGTTSWSGLRNDIDFRVGPYGKIEFTVDGEDYYVQYMPASMAQIESTPEGLITQMNTAGVNHCILQAGFTYGYMNDYNALAQSQFPSRFTGLFHVDEARANEDYWMSETRRAIEKLGLKGCYYSLEQFSRYDFDVWFDDVRFDDFWGLLESSQTSVFIEFSAIPNYDKQSYLQVMQRMAGFMQRFPSIHWVFVMTPPIPFFSQDGQWDFPDDVAGLYSNENVLLEVCYPISWGGRMDYPYPELQELIRGLRNVFGAEKLVWGSDMPNVERFCTYKQSLDYVRNYCSFLSADEMDKMLGRNIATVLNISGD